MPVGLPEVPTLLPVSGVKLATANAGISKKEKHDLALLVCVPGTTTAAVFTKNRFCAAPVTVSKSHTSENTVRAIIVNSGNANAGTGQQGLQVALQVCSLVASELGISATEVVPCSTGVIGVPLKLSDFENALPNLALSLVADNWLAAAEAIMTTDLLPKGVSRVLELDGVPVTITGIVKGSGMIRPNMATMLGFIATDAAIDKNLLDTLLHNAVEKSFNRITIDGDTSTNDACILMATGTSEIRAIASMDDSRCAHFSQALEEVMILLAQSLVRDGEGATKFITIKVTGAKSEVDASQLAFDIAHSPLVKTAMFASDPNWGRILAAIGRSSIESLEIDRVSMSINDVRIVDSGEPSATYTEQAGQQAMQADEIEVDIDLGLGAGSATVWTSDLSYDYVRINAEYRS